MKIIRNTIDVICNPKVWYQLYPYSPSWDKRLNQLMDEHVFVLESPGHTASLGGVLLWVANHPYASFRPRIQGHTMEISPSRSTILRAHRKYEEELLDHLLKQS